LKRTVLLFVIFFASIELYSQGFDWEYSPRLPYKIPRSFIGVSYYYGYNQNIGDFPLYENDVYSLNFKNGNGSLNQFTLSYQFWEKPIIAVFGNVFYRSYNSDFAQTVTYPRSNGKEDWLVEYRTQMQSSRNYFGVSIGGKYRLLNTYFSVGAQITGQFLLSSSSTARENIVSPDFEHYIDGSRERDVQNTQLPDFRNFLLQPEIIFAYDFNIAKGLYIQSSLRMQIPLFNATSSDKYYDLPIGIELSIYKNLNILN
jgi:hypothetical protein